MKSILLPLRVVVCLVGDTINRSVTTTTTAPPVSASWVNKVIVGLICCLSGSLVAHNAHAFLGDVAAEYRFAASSSS